MAISYVKNNVRQYCHTFLNQRELIKAAQCIAWFKIGRRRPNQEAAQRLLNAGWQVKVMAGNRTLHEKLILIDDAIV